jgi:hypothetical protein
VRAVRTAGADDLRRHGLGDVLLLEAEHGLQAAALSGIFSEGCLFLAELRDLLPELLVLLAGVTEVDVVVPHTPGVKAAAVREPLDGRDERDGPAAKQRDLPAVGSASRDGALNRALNLHSQCKDLQQDDDDQDQRVSEAEEEGIHLELKTGGSTSYYPILTVLKM